MGRAAEKILGAESRFLMSRVMPRQFLDGVEDYLEEAEPEGHRETVNGIRARAEELVEADADTVVDDPSAGALAICAVVLASYEALLPTFDDDKARTILCLQDVMGAVMRRPYEAAFRTLGKRHEPLDKIDAACRKEEPFYGAGWDIEFARPRPDLFEMKVHRCFFRDFFVRHGEPLLTTVMCAFDVNWMRAIEPSVSGLRAERTSLMSLGDEECRFAVEETDDPLATYSDTLDRRFVDAPDQP
jgi:hypothetical protein